MNTAFCYSWRIIAPGHLPSFIICRWISYNGGMLQLPLSVALHSNHYPYEGLRRVTPRSLTLRYPKPREDALSRFVLWRQVLALSPWHFCLSSVFHFPLKLLKLFHFIKYVAVHMAAWEKEGKVEDTDDMASSILCMRTFRKLCLHLVEEECQFCPGDMDQAMLPVSIFPFPIIYWFWSLMAALRWSFLHSCEWVISLPFWGLVMPNKHKHV